MDKKKELPIELQTALLDIVTAYEKEDTATHERQIRQWKKQEYYWAGFQRIWWDDVAHDWRVWADYDNQNLSLNEASYYDKPINIYRAYGESIIAALSASIPMVVGMPDDADNSSDVDAAKAATKLGELIYKHVNAPLLWVRALFIYYMQGMIAAYNYSETSEDYGTASVEKYEDVSETQKEYTCPNCKNVIDPSELPLDIQMKDMEDDQYGKDDDDVQADKLQENDKVICANCVQYVVPDVEDKTVIVRKLVGVTREPKARQCIDINGGLFVRVPNYARTQKDTPYIRYAYETHYTNVFKKYPHLRDKLAPNGSITTAGTGYDQYERWGRMNTQYLNEYPINTPTCANWWLRPQSFEIINDEKVRKQLYDRFPDGCKVVFVNKEYAESCNEDMDDHWTLTFNPLSEYLTFDPLGSLAVSVQDIQNDLVSLTLQTIEHGVPQTFADKKVLNFDQYRDTEVSPGSVYPVKAREGKSVADGFYTLQTASLGREVDPFSQRIGNLGEFVTGALPSIFGGAMPSSMRTASQQSMSRNQALQRLQNPWKMLNYWWKDIFGRVIPAYIKNMMEDERLVQKKNDSYINTVISRAELEGNIGSFELEGSDELPLTFEQKRDLIMNLLQLQSPLVMQTLATPENAELLREAIGLPEFDIPGAESRLKQFNEIKLLLQSAPTGPMQPTVMPDLNVDDHMVEISTLLYWMRGETGQLAKVNNQAGYANCEAHLAVHLQMQQQLNGTPQVNKPAPNGGPLKPIPQQEGNPNGQ